MSVQLGLFLFLTTLVHVHSILSTDEKCGIYRPTGSQGDLWKGEVQIPLHDKNLNQSYSVIFNFDERISDMSFGVGKNATLNEGKKQATIKDVVSGSGLSKISTNFTIHYYGEAVTGPFFMPQLESVELKLHGQDNQLKKSCTIYKAPKHCEHHWQEINNESIFKGAYSPNFYRAGRSYDPITSDTKYEESEYKTTDLKYGVLFMNNNETLDTIPDLKLTFSEPIKDIAFKSRGAHAKWWKINCMEGKKVCIASLDSVTTQIIPANKLHYFVLYFYYKKREEVKLTKIEWQLPSGTKDYCDIMPNFPEVSLKDSKI